MAGFLLSQGFSRGRCKTKLLGNDSPACVSPAAISAASDCSSRPVLDWYMSGKRTYQELQTVVYYVPFELSGVLHSGSEAAATLFRRG